MTDELLIWIAGGLGTCAFALATAWGAAVLRKLGQIDDKFEKLDSHLSELAKFQGATEARLSDFKRRLDDVEDRLEVA